MNIETIVAWLPGINASLNSLSTILLTAGFILIRRDRVRFKTAHRNCMVGAFSISAIFLLFYVLHKYLRYSLGGDVNTTFAGEGIWRPIYYTILITHLILAMVIVPLVLTTLILAIRQRFDRHRKWARWTYPIWYYVSVTGVLVYFFIYQWFPPPAAAPSPA